MKKLSLLVIGATFYGISAAATVMKTIIDSDNNKVLVIEKTMLLGSEFIDSMNIKQCDGEYNTEPAQEFMKDMISRGLLNEKGEVHVFPVAGMLAVFVKAGRIPVLLMTDIVSTEKGNGGYIVTLFNSDGFTQLFTKRIIDTTSEGVLPAFKYDISYNKSICAMLMSDGGKNPDNYADGNTQVLKGRFPDEYVLKVGLDIEDSWPVAREKLHNYWCSKASTEFAGWKIASIAAAFAYDFQNCPFTKNIAENIIWHPSAAYPDMLSAFEGGTSCTASL